MYRIAYSLGIALTLLASAASAEDRAIAMVATLLPPPVEALRAAPVGNAAMVSVPVLKQAVQKGETITADNIILQEIPAAQAFASTIASADELTGQQTIRTIAAGQPVNRLHVRIAPAISRNQMVTMVFRKGGIELSGRGQALEDGALGQSIRVINPTTRSTTTGVVAAGGTVEIN